MRSVLNCIRNDKQNCFPNRYLSYCYFNHNKKKNAATIRSKEIISYEGFQYVVDKLCKDGVKKFYRCRRRDINCTGRVPMKNGQIVSLRNHGGPRESATAIELREAKIKHSWTISNFSLFSEKANESLLSPTFGNQINCKSDWCLELRTRGTINNKDFISLYLSLVTCSVSNISTKYKFSILNSKGEEKYVRIAEKFRCFKPDWGWRKFIKRDFLFDKLNGLLPNDTLTIFCEMSIAVPHVNRSECSLSNDLGRIFKIDEFTDVILLVNKREFHAHKFILSARSPVFAAMFEHKMKEINQSIVTITDVEPTIFKEFLRFIYNGHVINLRSIADGLLVIADKYGVDTLKVMCEKSLRENLSCENAAYILILANIYNADQLKEETRQFINAYLSYCYFNHNKKKNAATIRSKEIISYEGFQYVVDKLCKDGVKKFYRCRRRDINCTGRVPMKNGQIVSLRNHGGPRESATAIELREAKMKCWWTISNFSLFSEKANESLLSPTFGNQINCKSDWCLELRTRGTINNIDFISLYLSLITCSVSNISTKYKFSILNSKGEEKYVRIAEKFRCFKPDWGWKKFIKRDFLFDKLNGLLPNDTLTIFCEMRVAVPHLNKCGPIKIPESSLPNDLGRMFNMEKFTDVTLLVNEQEFHAHKFILSARSSVFAAMFEHEMMESNQSSVTITDVEPTIFKEFLRFIYTSHVTNLRSIADGLLVVADKYGVDTLKVMCEESLRENLSCENAAELLILADLYNADQLKEETLQFINAPCDRDHRLENHDTVTPTPNRSSFLFCSSHPKHVIVYMFADQLKEALQFINTYAAFVKGTTGWKTIMQSYPHLIEAAFRSALDI